MPLWVSTCQITKGSLCPLLPCYSMGFDSAGRRAAKATRKPAQGSAMGSRGTYFQWARHDIASPPLSGNTYTDKHTCAVALGSLSPTSYPALNLFPKFSGQWDAEYLGPQLHTAGTGDQNLFLVWLQLPLWCSCIPLCLQLLDVPCICPS